MEIAHTTLKIGLEKPVRVLHVTDTHVALSDERDDERCRRVIERCQRVLKPMHQLHIEPTKKFANIIIPEGGNNEVAINLITDYIKGRLTTNSKK